MARRYFGSVRRLPSGRWQARYQGPDGRFYTARREEDGGPLTFSGKLYATAYLASVQTAIRDRVWVSPNAAKAAAAPPVLLRDYARTWLATRELSPSTHLLYQHTLGKQILPTFGGTALTAITPVMVREWHADLRTQTGPTQRAHAYSLLRTILNTALADDLIPSNPCRVRGAGSSKRAHDIRPASLAELEALTQAMPDRLRLMVLLAAWCALRFGELAELRRADIDVKRDLVHVRRGVVQTASGLQVKAPKSEAGKRDVAIPPHLMPAVKAHLRDHVAASTAALLFPGASGGHLQSSALHAVFYRAREAAGRPDLRFHDLRHTGAVMAAWSGATPAELMARLGHSTVTAAMRYQHASADRDKVIAAALSDLAAGTVTAITHARTKASRKTAGR
jgi:integrase